MCRLSWNLGASNFRNPQGLSRPVMGLLYLSYNWGKRLLASSVCLTRWNNSTPTRRFSRNSCIWVIFEDLFIKFKFHYNLLRTTVTLHEDLRIYDNISQNSSANGKCCRQNQNTHFVFTQFFFLPRKSYILWDNVAKNTVQPVRPQTTILV